MQIHFVGQGDDFLGAGDNAKATSLAPLRIHLDGTLHFCHKISVFTPYYIIYRTEPGAHATTNKAAKIHDFFAFILHHVIIWGAKLAII